MQGSHKIDKGYDGYKVLVKIMYPFQSTAYLIMVMMAGDMLSLS